MPGNKTLDYQVAYYGPDQLKDTPARRYYLVAEGISATSVSRALSKFFKEILEEEGWGKTDVVVVGCMPTDLPNGRVGSDDEED